MKRRVAITGLGAVTAAGEGHAALWKAALEGRSLAGPLPIEADGWNPIGAAVPDFEPEKFVTQRKSLKVMARDIQLAVAAASLAADDSGVRTASIPRERFGVIVGAGVLNHELDELAYSVLQSLGDDGRLDLKKFGTEGLPALFPLWLLKYLPNMPACHVSILLDLQGPNNTITTGASSGLQAVCEAARMIQRGSADAMLAGGAESKLNPLGLSHYEILGVLARSSDAYRPFDARSGGLVVGEGAGFLVLEEFEHAKARGATVYAEITGCGVAPSGFPGRAMRLAIRESGVKAADFDYLQASGIGIAEEDRREAEAIEATLGESRDLCVAVSKNVTGFTGFSAGALDLIISSLALKNQEIPPVPGGAPTGCRYGFKLSETSVKKKIRHALTNAHGMNGQCVSVATRAAEDAR